MSRARRVIRNVASSYVHIFASTLYVLASVPLALRFLTKEEFGLWALMTQISGYLALIDLGITSSVARLLIDCKDRPNDGEYGSLIQTGGLVLVCQGVLILAIGLLVSPLVAGLLNIPSHLTASFVCLLRWQCAIVAAGFTARVFGAVVWAHQRSDFLNWTQAGLALLNFPVLWGAFRLGTGVYSVLWVNATSTLATSLSFLVLCSGFRLLPTKAGWGTPSWVKFKELFRFGKDMFLITLGRQLAMASQTLVISRSLGLAAVAAWSVGTRVFNLLCWLIWRIFDFSEAAFSEMEARGERDRLRDRFRSSTMLSASLSGTAAVLFTLCNSAFVSLWTGGKISWPIGCDVLLGIWLVILALGRFHGGLVVVSKRIELMRYIYFTEGVFFVVLATLLAHIGGLPAIVTVSILCSIGFSVLRGVKHTVSFLGFPLRDVVVGWLAPMSRLLCLLIPPVVLVGWALWPLSSLGRLLAAALPASALAGWLLLRYGIPKSLHADVLKHSPKTLSRLLAKVLNAG